MAKTQDPPCPRAADHTPAPNGYVAWHEWAAAMYYRGWRQSRCDGCDLYTIWRGGRAPVSTTPQEETP